MRKPAGQPSMAIGFRLAGLAPRESDFIPIDSRKAGVFLPFYAGEGCGDLSLIGRPTMSSRSGEKAPAEPIATCSCE